MFGPLLDVQMSLCVAGARVCAPCQKWAKREGFGSMSKNDGRRGTFQEDVQRCISRGRRSTRDMFIRDVRTVRKSGRWFPERGCTLEHQIFRFAKMILHDRCSISYELASLFCGRRITLNRWGGTPQNALVRGRQLCTQHSIFEGSMLRFWCGKVENWGSLAE